MTALGAIIQRFSQPPPRENPTLEALGAQNRETAKVRRQRKERRQREVIRNTLDRTRPVVSPTDEEIDAVKTRLGYEKSHLHFAVSGPPGSGKSSLINALRGLKKNDREAAPVGSVETTTTITRYPDARQEIPFKWFVWYDVPGAGTLNVPSWQYFNQQGLFIFDFIILVYDTVSHLLHHIKLILIRSLPAFHRGRRRYSRGLPPIQHSRTYCPLQGRSAHLEHDDRRRRPYVPRSA